MSQKQVEEKGETTTLLRQLREECAQIYELSVEEQGLIHQLCEMLSEVQSFFKIGVKITPSLFPSTVEVKQAILSVSGDIVLVKHDIIESQPLYKFDSTTVVEVLSEAADELNKYAKGFRTGISNRISLMETLVKELKRLHDLNKMHSEEVAPDQYSMQGIASDDLEHAP
ncbi:MAG: hypothetical protein HYY22_02300 [Thaumarchaeota archaeon]|nr:hypothetical protein [Nitrososphaerota archaeon]